MPRTALVPVPGTTAGILNTAGAIADVANGNEFQNSGKAVAVVTNPSGNPHSVTFGVQASCDNVPCADRVVALAAGESKIIGPFNTAEFNTTGQKVNVDWSASADTDLVTINIINV